MTIELGDEVRWVPTGEIGTVLGLTTEPSAIVVFPHGRHTIGLSKLEPLHPTRDVLAEIRAELRALRDRNIAGRPPESVPFYIAMTVERIAALVGFEAP